MVNGGEKKRIEATTQKKGRRGPARVGKGRMFCSVTKRKRGRTTPRSTKALLAGLSSLVAEREGKRPNDYREKGREYREQLKKGEKPSSGHHRVREARGQPPGEFLSW